MSAPETRRFQILGPIGSGGEGRVWLARDRYTGTGPLALKVLSDQGAARAMQDEFLALRELSHPGLVRVFDRGILPESGEPFTTSEYVEGVEFTAAAAQLEPGELVDLTAAILRALSHIHRRGFVHHDLKPGNILVTAAREPKILDFGLAVREGERSAEGRLRGTLPYVAPETLEGRPVDRRADLYSLGVVLYQALTGLLPERGEDLLPEFEAAQIAALAEPFDHFLERLLRRDPDRRPASAVRALEILAERSGRDVPQDTEETLRANLAGGRFVGREVELGTLATELRSTVLADGRERSRRVVLVRGEPGIGKHRLLEEFKDRCQREGVDVFSATCYQGEEAAYASLVPLLRALLARVGEDSRRAADARPALSRILPDLGGEPPGPLAGPEDRVRWLEEIAVFFREAAQGRRGYVLAIEEIQFATPEVLNLIGYLARSVCLAGEFCPPLLVVLSLRDAEVTSEELRALLEDLGDESLLLPVPLPSFTRGEVAEYVSTTLGMPDPPARLIDRLYTRSGGSPFVLEELLKSLVEEGTIYYRGDRWRVRGLARLRIPDNVAKVIQSRVTALPAGEKNVLRVVAAYGEPVPVSVVDGALPGASSLVTDLLRRQYLVDPGGDGVVGFRHTMVAQFLLERSRPDELRRIHSRIGEVLEEIGIEAGLRPEKVAHHYSLGEDRRKALLYALAAARRMSAAGRFDQAAIYYGRAVARLEREDPRRPDLLEALGDAHAGGGRLELAAAAYLNAIDGEEDRGLRASRHRRLAEVLERTGDYEGAHESVREGLKFLPADEQGERIALLRLLGAVEKQRGEYEAAILAVREGLRLARGEHTAETASLLNLLGNVHMLLGDRRKALNLHLRSLRISESIDFEAGAASSLLNLGTLMNAWGELDRALGYFARSLRIAEGLVNLPMIALIYNNMGNIHAERGDVRRAEYYHRRSLGLRRRIGDPFAIAMSFGNIGSMHRLRGHWGLAVAYYERAIRHFERIGNAYGSGFFRTHLGDMMLRIGVFDRAEDLLSRAEASAEAHGHRVVLARVNLLSGRLFRLRGEFADARRRLTRAVEIDRGEGRVESLLELAFVHRSEGRKGRALLSVAKAFSEAKRARSESLDTDCRLVRGELGSGGSHSADTPDGGSRIDVETYIERARERNRPEALSRGLTTRARRRLAAGEFGPAALDVSEALDLTGAIAATLPDELAAVYRRDPRRVELQDLEERIRKEKPDEEAPETGLFPGQDEMKPEDLHRLLEINKRLNSETDLAKLLRFIMDTAVELTGAERGFLILMDGDQIGFQVARNFRRKEVDDPELKVSRSIVKQVMAGGEPVLTDNASEDERLSKFKSVDNLRLMSIVSVPFESRGATIGALYLDNPAQKAVFTQDDVDTLLALSDQAAIAIQNLQKQAKLTEKLEIQDSELKRVKQVLDETSYRYDYSEIIGTSSRMKEVFLLLDKIIDTEVPVLIQGESGTGKELVARAIHFKGPRKDTGEFVPVNAGAVPDSLLESEFFGYVKGAFTGANTDKTGYFEQADRGTLFLDEIGDMDFDMQKKLLRVLQQGEVRPVGGKKTVKVDVRLVCATNRDLRQLMMEKKFREDLFYRINVIAVHLPTLKERREDIPLLADAFATQTSEEMGTPPKEIDQEAMALLTAYDWPGNVRELQNEMKKVIALSDEEVVAEDLSPHIQGERAGKEPTLVPQKGTLKETMEATEKSIIVRALDETGGNQTQAAKNLGISRVWLRKKMEKYGLL
ncbi:MAG: sigma 54-interacting transcriptional regulator [Planctomycetota bacterium]